MTTEDYLALAADHISAHEHDLGEQGRFYSYTESQISGTVFVVHDEDMIELGRDLAANRRDAYSHWCSETSATEVTIEAVQIAYPRAATEWAETVADASLNGDVEVLAAMRHLGRDIIAAA